MGPGYHKCIGVGVALSPCFTQSFWLLRLWLSPKLPMPAQSGCSLHKQPAPNFVLAREINDVCFFFFFFNCPTGVSCCRAGRRVLPVPVQVVGDGQEGAVVMTAALGSSARL